MMETSIDNVCCVKNIAIFISGRLYRNYSSIYKDKYTDNFKYDFSFLKLVKDFYNSLNINVYFFASLSKDCDIPIITHEFINVMKMSNDLGETEDHINIEEVICPSIIYSFVKRPETSYENTYKMFYHYYKCFQLIEKYSKKHNVKFDVLIKWRTDISVETNCIQSFMEKTIEHFKQIKDNKNLYVPSHDLFWGISDQLAYGNYHCMNQYCNIIGNLINLCNGGIVYHPETLLGAHCSKLGLIIDTFDLIYKLL